MWLLEGDYEMLLLQLEQTQLSWNLSILFLLFLADKMRSDFAKLFDDTLMDIAIKNQWYFSVKTDGGAKVVLFDRITEYISDGSKRDALQKLSLKVVGVSFEHIFNQKFDFYATIFEYLIKDYNTNSGGKYAEYFTPTRCGKNNGSYFGKRACSKCYCLRPFGSSGTLLMKHCSCHWWR